MGLITPAEFRSFYPVLTGTGEDTRLGVLIDAADALASRWCGFPPADDGSQTFQDVTYTTYPSPAVSDPRCLALGIRPVVSVTTAHVSDDWSYGAADLVDSADYVLDKPKGRLHLLPNATALWATGLRVNRVVLVAGYATVPADLKEAIAALVRHLIDTAPPNQTSYTAGGQTQSRAPATGPMPEALEGRFASFRFGSALVG